MINVAITGGIACGKSEVGSFLSARGVPVCDADALAHAALAPEGEAYDAVVRAFGRDILDAEGRIDRGRLGDRVFGSATERDELNRLVHPAVIRAWKQWLRAREDEGARLAAVIIPLLYEVGETGTWDAVVCVTAPRETQVARLLERGLTRQQAGQRIAAQMDVKEKAIRADYVLINHGTKALLNRQMHKVLESILENA